MNLYIAGPMTGKPELNKALFEATKLRLERLGHYAVTPFELNARVWAKWHGAAKGEPTIEELTALPYGHPIVNDFLLGDIEFITHTADGIAVLPGWQKSRGTKLEILVATTMGKPVYDARTMKPMNLTAEVRVEQSPGEIQLELGV